LYKDLKEIGCVTSPSNRRAGSLAIAAVLRAIQVVASRDELTGLVVIEPRWTVRDIDSLDGIFTLANESTIVEQIAARKNLISRLHPEFFANSGMDKVVPNPFGLCLLHNGSMST
jgi:hypothetical protein